MKDRREHATVEERIALGNAKVDAYNRRLLALAAVTAFLLLALMGVTLWQLNSIAQDTRSQVGDAREQAAQVQALLEQQTRSDAENEASRLRAVDRLVAEQYRALVAHDRRAEELLRRALALISEEVNAPRNREQPPRPVPPQVPALQAPAPRVGPPTGAAPAPKPASKPAPAPCDKRGKSGKCRR